MTAREALKSLRDNLEIHLMDSPMYSSDHCTIDAVEVAAMIAEADKVLKTPERNCERFNNGLDAIHGWEDYLEKHPELPPSCMTSGAMIPWLFEFSEEKGKTNAST